MPEFPTPEQKARQQAMIQEDADEGEARKRRLAHAIQAGTTSTRSPIGMGELWGTERVHVGAVTEPTWVKIPHDFSSVVSLVVNVSTTTKPSQDQQYLRWWLYDSVDGKHWWSVEDTLGAFNGIIGHEGFQRPATDISTRRFVVPVGPQIQLSFKPEVSGRAQLANVEFADVAVTIFWRGIG
jgi:hypothetical protein